MRKISEIYDEYKIMPSLQEHMLRVAAVASLICDNFNEPLPNEEIILACLLHDMGNIIKFNMEILPEFFKPEGVDYWKNIKKEYVEKYGENEHKATMQIMRKLGMPDRIISIVAKINFLLICDLSTGNNINTKLAFYADSRVDPYGIVSYEERMEEGKKRYKNHKSTFGAIDEEVRKKMVECGRQIEKQIFSKCKIKPEDINDEAIKPVISKLRDFMVR